MKNILTDFQQKYESLRGPVSYKKSGINPKKDWLLLLSGFAVSFVVVAVCAVFVYIKINSSTLFSVPIDNTNQQIRIDSALLSQVVNDIHARETKVNDLNQSLQIPPDPSL